MYLSTLLGIYQKYLQKSDIYGRFEADLNFVHHWPKILPNLNSYFGKVVRIQIGENFRSVVVQTVEIVKGFRDKSTFNELTYTHFFHFLALLLFVLRKIGKFQWDLNYDDDVKYKNLEFLVFLQGEFFSLFLWRHFYKSQLIYFLDFFNWIFFLLYQLYCFSTSGDQFSVTPMANILFKAYQIS